MKRLITYHFFKVKLLCKVQVLQVVEMKIFPEIKISNFSSKSCITFNK